MKVKPFCIAVLLLVVFPQPGFTAAWPSKPIRWIVPYPPGGGNDNISRLMANELSKRLGVKIVVENKGGANGTIGLNSLKHASPDGYTVSTVPSGPLDVNPALNSDIQYDPLKDFTYIAPMIKFPLFLVASHRSGITNIGQLIQKARQNPGSVTYSSAGVGNSTHLAGVLLGELTGTKLLHVPYTGTGPAAVAVVSGEVDLTVGSGPSILPMVSAGKVNLIGVGEAKRLHGMPDVPTLAEQGVRGYEAYSWAGVIAPAGVAKEVSDAMSNEILKAVSDSEFQRRIYDNGMVPLPGSGEDFRAIVDRDTKKWGELLKSEGLIK